MATILIADDNSNIQKMVALAFKGEGIDVVAVGNGEAAVRKAPALMPDLILADIFMPVRNGYEVCDFIKQNPRLAHVPVILLIGAFDPFDEKEAQRVGADGVLKKPFVPPDPLVSLVKELLAKSAAEHLVPVSATATVATTEKDSFAAPAVALEPVAPREIAAAPLAFEMPVATEPEDERPFKTFTFREEPTNSGKEGGSSAFGSFLEPATHERVDTTVGADLGSTLRPTEAHSPEQQGGDGAIEDLPPKGYSGFSSWLSKTPTLDSVAPPVEDTCTSLFSPSADRVTRGWEVAHSPEARPEEETIVEPLDSFLAAHFLDYPNHPGKPESEGPKANEIEEVVAEATPEVSGSFESHAPPAPAFAPQLSADDTQTFDAIRSVSMPWHSVPSKLHDAHEEPPEPSAEPATEYSATRRAAEEPFAEEMTMDSSNESPSGVDASDTDAPIYEAGGVEDESFDSSLAMEALPAEISSSNAQISPVPAASLMDPRQIEEIVTRVVERMQPQVLEVITREILRPVVEALVRRQLELK